MFDLRLVGGHPRRPGPRGAAFRVAHEQGVPRMFAIAQASHGAARHLGDAGLEAMQGRDRLVGATGDLVEKAA